MRRRDNMSHIRPITDLRDNFSDISKVVNETDEPVFLTDNGHGIMVVMSMGAYERHRFESEVYFKLKEAELEAQITNERFSHEEIFEELRTKLIDEMDMDNA